MTDIETNKSLHQIIKVLIFASVEPLTIQSLYSVLGGDINQKIILEQVEKINQEFVEQEQPFEVLVASGTLVFRTRSEYQNWLQKLFKDNAKKKLSTASLEVLSIVAYKQPITKNEIEEIRGVTVDVILKNLLERKLLAIVGRSSRIGSPNEYGTTKEFCRYFNINQVPRDLPKFSEFSNLVESSEYIKQIKGTAQEEKNSEEEQESQVENLNVEASLKVKEEIESDELQDDQDVEETSEIQEDSISDL